MILKTLKTLLQCAHQSSVPPMDQLRYVISKDYLHGQSPAEAPHALSLLSFLVDKTTNGTTMILKESNIMSMTL